MLNNRTIAGHSLALNIFALTLNFAGVALLVLGSLPIFEKQQLLFFILGGALTAVSIAGLILLKGRLLIATVARVLTGSVFIVSGLIKANDPIGFSYKLEEYFDDGALAYRIKEWFNAPGFSLESLIHYALPIAVVICVIEIVLGVLLIVGGKSRLTSWLLLLTMLFFTFLTWHTASCNASHRFLDRNTYRFDVPAENAMANLKMKESRTNKDIRITGKTSSHIVVDEYRMPQCVNDCGCFGDAMKGSVGRSLTPLESFWKDLVLLYFAVWIFAARRITEPNSISRNWRIIPVTAILLAALCWLFDWYFPLLFGGLAVLGSLWLYRSGGKALGNHYVTAAFVALLSAGFAWFCLEYDTLRDFRPYAARSDLRAKMSDAQPELRRITYVYRNARTGKTVSFDATDPNYTWILKNREWKLLRREEKVIIPGRLPSIDSNAFDPFVAVGEATALEKTIIGDRIKPVSAERLRLLDIAANTQQTIALQDYNVESYPAESFRILDTIIVAEQPKGEIRLREYILGQPQIIILVSKDLRRFDRSVTGKIGKLAAEAKAAKVPFIMITAANAETIAGFRKSTGLQVPAFTCDETELKVISRSNPALMILRKGKVAGKYPHSSLPTFDWIQKNLLAK
jgi:uncharacterized membrane protein YphA (DoxX/SURF4 family)